MSQVRVPGGALQEGVALIVGLIILVVLALLGTAAYSVSTQDERIAGNARDHARAMDAAESMLRDCEAFVMSGSAVFTSAPGTGGMYIAQNTPGATWIGEIPGVWASAGYTTRTLGTITGTQWSQQPQCIAEEFPASAIQGLQPVGPAGLPTQSASTLYVAHITARGYGANPNTIVTLESYVEW